MCPDGYGQRVLVVDDDVSIRVLLSELLTSEGYNVFEAGDGLDACRELEKRRFDLVISDYHMPRFDGLQLLSICRTVWPETAVIIASGASSAWPELALSGGAQACVKKPWERATLISEVRLAIEQVSVRTASH